MTTATLFEASEHVSILPSRIRPLASSMRLQGRAFPIALPPGDNLALHHAIYAAIPGDVLVASTKDREFGYWGEIMTEAAIARGLGGLVIDGSVRDSAEIEALGFPVFSTGLFVRGTTKCSAVPIPETIRIDDVSISAGDLVVGDHNGVIVIPKDEVDRALSQAEERSRRECAILERIRSGESTIDVLRLKS